MTSTPDDRQRDDAGRWVGVDDWAAEHRRDLDYRVPTHQAAT